MAWNDALHTPTGKRLKVVGRRTMHDPDRHRLPGKHNEATIRVEMAGFPDPVPVWEGDIKWDN